MTQRYAHLSPDSFKAPLETVRRIMAGDDAPVPEPVQPSAWLA
jgi:hypothetical protein